MRIVLSPAVTDGRLIRLGGMTEDLDAVVVLVHNVDAVGIAQQPQRVIEVRSVATGLAGHTERRQVTG